MAEVLMIDVSVDTGPGHLTIHVHNDKYMADHDDLSAVDTISDVISCYDSVKIALRLAAMRKMPDAWVFGRRVLNSQGENIGKRLLIGKGTYGKVYHYPYFNTVLKIYNDNVRWTITVEIAVYKLIATVYPVPEQYGLPSLLGYGESYILMPYYGKVMTQKSAPRYSKDIARAIHNLHLTGVLHRDVKYDNFIVTHGLSGIAPVILIDFGLSSWNIVTCRRERVTQVQSRCFRAPEVALGNHLPLQFTADIWSFGVILASQNRFIVNPQTDQDVLPQLTKLFGLEAPLSVDDLQKDLLPRCKDEIGEAAVFLNLNPSRRQSLSGYLGIAPLTYQSISTMVPVSDETFALNLTQVNYLLSHCCNWLSYFAAMIYQQYLKCDEAVKVANLLFGGETPSINIPNLSRLEGRFYRHNICTLMLLRYPGKHLGVIAKYCFVLTFTGVQYPHQEMVDWIDDVIKGDTVGTSSTAARSSVFFQLYQNNYDLIMKCKSSLQLPVADINNLIRI